jgi:hypothetical protein
MSLVGRSALIVLAFAGVSFAQDIRTATLVGTVTDASGSAVPNAQVTVVNVQTKVETHGQTTPEGDYYVPFLNIGQYEARVEAPGFMKFVRTGLILEAGSTVRVDAKLEVGATTQTVEVTAATPLLATDDAVVGGLDDAKKIEESSMLQSKPQHLMYYMEGAYSDNGGTYHILGQPATLINYTVDGANAKQSIRTAIGETSTSLTVPVDAVAEAQVWTTGIPAEIGHSAGGTYNMVLKSGANQLHWSAEERYINKDFVDRAYFQQSVANLATAPFEYHNFDTALSGPIVIPKVYDGRNKTFFLLAYRLDYDHEANVSTTSTPDQGMLTGNFAFGGLGYPIYDPKSIACTLAAGCPSSTGWSATPFPGDQIPQSRFDPVAAKFLSYNPYTPPNTAGFYSTTGPNNNLTALTHYLSDREGYVVKIDEQIGPNDRLFARYAGNMFREPIGRNAVQYAWGAIDSTEYSYGLAEPIDVKVPTLGYYHNFGPTLINEFRFAYQRRNDTVHPELNNQGWAGILGIPGVGPQTFPGFVGASGGSSVTWTANPSGSPSNTNLRTLNEDFEIIDNVTKVYGAHTFKAGYQGMIVKENDVAVSQPSGVYNFATSGSGLPFTPNTGNSFASFLLGSVTSATFTNLLANYLPRWWSHQFYVQDDWRFAHNLTINIGVRYSYENPANTKWGLKSEFNPSVVDPLTGLMGAITNPKGTLYNADYKNFAPRLGVSWNFARKFVYRGSFSVFTQDIMPELGQDNYLATAQVQQPSGNPYPAFYLSQGPGPITYTINGATDTANYVGTNYSARTATYIDPNLRNPYSMTWGSGFQWEFKPSQLAELVYQGSAGVGLFNSVNMNVLPLSIYNSTNTTLLSQVYASSQNYLTYPQFGSITAYGNYGHSTYHALTARLERRFNNGFSYNFLFTWSKNLGGAAGSGEQYYDWNLTKGPILTDVKFMGVATATYDLPFGKHRKYLNRNTTAGYITDVLVGGWTFTSIQSMRTGEPLSFTMAGSPYKQLPGQTIPNIVLGQKINVPNYSVGTNLWPESNQNPFFNINAFSYPGNYQNGDAGVGIGRTGNVWWPEYSLYKSWTYREKFKLTVRFDGHNVLPKTRAFLAPNTTVNITSPVSFGRFAPLTGYSYSNWYTPNPNWQGILRLEF